MSMKYIKLFESWLNEAEVERKFSSSNPKATPVLETTIGNLYTGGDLNTNVLESIIKRSIQKSGEKFKKSAGENIEIKGGDSGKWNTKTGNALKKYVNFLKTYYTTSDSKNFFTLEIYDGNLKGILILPKEIKFYKKEISENCSNLPIIFDSLDDSEGAISGFLGQVMMHAQRNFNSNLVSSIYNEEKNYDAPIAEIFAGEGKASNLAYNATIAGTKFLAVATPDEEPKNIESSPLDSTLIVDKDKTIYIGQIRFDFDKATLKEESKEVLGGKDLRIALSDATKSIEIVGHTDGKGDASYNQKLSENRAKSVLEYLKTLSWYKKLEVEPTIKGVGSNEPIKDDNKGTDPIFSSINRRVEFLIDGAKANYSEILSATEKMKS